MAAPEGGEAATAEVLADRYQVRARLPAGRVGPSVALLARDLRTARLVVLEPWGLGADAALRVVGGGHLGGLERLIHTALPRYLDTIPLGPLTAPLPLVVVREHVPGELLESAAQRGLRLSAAEAVAFLVRALNVLAYLHDQSPSRLHGHLDGRSFALHRDGHLFLVDLATGPSGPADGTRAPVWRTYAAPEQAWGRALPATDLYRLALTTLRLVTGLHPGELSRGRWRDALYRAWRPSSGLERLFEALLAPVPEDRPASAANAQQALRRVVEGTGRDPSAILLDLARSWYSERH